MNKFMPIKLGLLAAAFALALPGHARAGENDEKNEQKVQLADCPQPVQDTIKQQAGDAKIVEIEKKGEEDEGKGVYYEAKVKGAGGKMSEIEVAPDGKLIKVSAADKDDDDDEQKEKK